MDAASKAKERIKKKYLESHKISGTEKMILFFEGLLKEAEENNLEAYKEWAHGYLEGLKRNYDSATSHFNQSSQLDKDFAYPWHGLGNVYYEKKEYDRAIECYEKSIELDGNYTYSLNGLGIEYFRIKEYDRAIECYEKCIELDGNYAKPNHGMGFVYEKIDQYKKAEFYYKKALELYEKVKDNYWVSITKQNLNNIRQRLESEETLEKKRTDDYNPVSYVLKATREEGVGGKGIEEKASENKKNFLSFLDEIDGGGDDTEYFQVLRRWNSYTPIIADNYYISKGGGYFLRAGGKGIVIDPGFNFIDNFKGSGHKFAEIDIVLISHAHNDHTADLESILTLIYKYNKEIKDSTDPKKENTIRNEIARQRNCAIEDVTSGEIEKEFYKVDSKRKIIDFYMTNSVYQKFSGLLKLSSKEDYRIHIIEAGDRKKLNGSVWFRAIGAKHHDIISDAHSVGFAIEVGEWVLIYTGDTGWSRKIEENYIEALKGYEDKKKLLVAHLGGFKETEIHYINEEDEDREQYFYPHHLGRLGLVKINELIEPEICFISEFGEELKGNRIPIAKIYQEAFKDKIKFFPADIGLNFNFKTEQINVVIGVNHDESKLERSECMPEEVETCLLRKDYSLHYFKRGCVESDLVQILRDDYDKSNS